MGAERKALVRVWRARSLQQWPRQTSTGRARPPVAREVATEALDLSPRLLARGVAAVALRLATKVCSRFSKRITLAEQALVVATQALRLQAIPLARQTAALGLSESFSAAESRPLDLGAQKAGGCRLPALSPSSQTDAVACCPKVQALPVEETKGLAVAASAHAKALVQRQQALPFSAQAIAWRPQEPRFSASALFEA